MTIFGRPYFETFHTMGVPRAPKCRSPRCNALPYVVQIGLRFALFSAAIVSLCADKLRYDG